MKTISFLICSLATGFLYGQSFPEDLPMEEIRMELSKTSLIPGEEISVAIQCLVKEKDFFISSIAYLELIDPANKPVLQKKVRIREGMGNVKVYLPSHLQSGVYTVLVYTKWMRNFGHENFAIRKLNLINPYIPLPVQITESTAISDTLSFQYYPEGGRFFRQENQLIEFRIENRFGQISPAQVLIKDDSSNVLLDTSSEGLGDFRMSAKEFASYSVVMIDSLDQVHFSRFQTSSLFPTPCIIRETKNQIEISELKSLLGGRLELWQNGNKKRSFIIDRPLYVFDKVQLDKGIIQIRILAEDETIFLKSLMNKPIESSALVQMDKYKFRSRDTVSATISVDIPIISTLIVRKQELFPTESNYGRKRPLLNVDQLSLTSINLQSNNDSINKIFLPDIGGELIEGAIKNPQGDAVPNHNFFVTLIGKDLRIMPLTSDEHGQFKFIRSDESSSSREMQFSNIDGNTIELESPYISNHDFIPKKDLGYYNPSSWLLEKAQQVQIKNLYASSDQQNMQSSGARQLIGYTTPENVTTYYLDDFTRFPTITDHIVEYIPNVLIRNTAGEKDFTMRNVKNQSTENQQILSTLNGVIWSPLDILEFNPALIEKIEVCINQFQFGNTLYTGSINFMTYPDTFIDVRSLKNVSSKKFKEVDNLEDGFIKRSLPYSPDFRDVLLWKPHQTLSQSPQIFKFVTSDIQGKYELIISGSDEETFVYKVVEFEIGE